MASVVSVALQMGLGIFLPWWIVRRDQKRLSGRELDRTWNDASFWAAIVTFGPLCIPVHFVKARRSLAGLLLGIAWMVAAFAAIALVDRAVSGIP